LNLRYALAALGALFLIIGAWNVAWAHGGGHPTPWPTPTPGKPTPPRRPGKPTPSPGATPSGLRELRTPWKRWWEHNKWRFTWTAQKQTQTTGEAGGENRKLIEFLTRQLRHSYFDIRSAAAVALGKAKARESAESLKKLIEDRNPVVAESAVLALGMMGHPQSLPFLLRVFNNRKQAMGYRIYAAIALGLIRDPASTRALLECAGRTQENDELKAACLLALSLIRAEEAGPLFVGKIRAARIKEAEQAVAASSLGKLGKQSVRLGRTDVATIRFLLHQMLTRRKDEDLRRSAALAIAALAPRSELDDRALLRALSAHLRDRDADVRNFTLMAVAEIAHCGRAVEICQSLIRGVLRSDKDHHDQAYACVATGLARDRESVPKLRSLLLTGKSPDLRAAAAVGLGLLKDVGSTPHLIRVIEGKGDSVVKGYACIALGIMGAKDNKEALPVLRRVLTDKADPQLRAAAAIALSMLNAAGALDALLGSLDDGNHYYRMSAVIAIGRFRDLRAVEPLIRLFESKEPNDELRAIICVALGNIVEEADIPVLRRVGRYCNFTIARFQILMQIIHLL
jgi:HEAT repeat protein